MTKEEREALAEFKAAVKGIESETDIIGCQFICIDNYTNQYGEVSRQVINAGIPRTPVMLADLAKYEKLQADAGMFALLVAKHGNETTIKAFMELKNSIKTCVSGTNVYSQAQKDAYIPINKGMKYCIATKRLMVYGYSVSKVVIVPGEYKETKKRKLTLCKDEIKKLAGIKGDTYRQFILEIGKLETVKIAGKKITFPLAA